MRLTSAVHSSSPSTKAVVEHGGQLIAVKQLVIDQHGRRWRYDWKHLEDENGFLTDAPLYIDKNIVTIARDVFSNEWGS